MSTSRGLDWRTVAYVAGGLVLLYTLAEAQFGPAGSFLVAAGLIVALVAVVWWWFFSFAGHVRRGWPKLTHGLGLWKQDPIKRINEEFSYTWPSITRVKRVQGGFTVWVTLLPGQTPGDLGDHTEAIAHAWRVFRVDCSSPMRGVVVLRAWVADPLDSPFGPTALAMPGLRDVEAKADPLPDPWAPTYDSVELGRCDDGSPWVLRLHGTHVLVAGVTGAGKGSILWGVTRGLLPAARAGLVELWACDPKRMELSYGRALFQRYSSDPAEMVEMLEDAVAEMSARADRFAGKVRKHEPSTDCPFIVVMVDELAFLTAYQPDRDLRKRADAALATLTSQGRSVGFCVLGALQDPRKEVMNIRNLFPDRIALRLDEPGQVDMVLGNGARDRGATADLISPVPELGAGVGFVKRETQPEPVRVRAAYVSDADIDALVRDFPAGGGAA
ncbi:FtsK/SpoIIIE domain-containing protein [Yinghuangia sp. YIM S10712]|uniref:FtsK/SpoIIIE domain-containing protein n=1 Tax=Yinghuangia sp. YIM S10712 TaxID=3436930 RepID=UPI003F533378